MADAAALPSDRFEQPLALALRQIAIFADLEEEQLQWFASQARDMRLAPGEIVIRAGDPADALFVLLEGEIQGRAENAPGDLPLFIARAGQVTGMLPFSRMTTFSITARAVLPTRVARFHKDHFPEMLQRIPQLLPRLMGVLADRIRESSRSVQQREKLMALGKLSAGLAHELNNPAAAARRSAEALRKAAHELRRIDARLNRSELSNDQRVFLSHLQEEAIRSLANTTPLDALDQSDLEDSIGSWLEKRNIPDPFRLAGPIVEAGITVHSLDALESKFERSLLEEVVQRFVHSVTAEKLTLEIEAATGRISELVRAIKEYSYMDQMPEQEIDVHAGIESTLTILNFRLKKGVNVIRQFDRSLPRIRARGSELNQVWTNLIDNAIDAMDGKGTLAIRTAHELSYALVEIKDNGAGIPEEIQSRIFEPFFTTKGVGSGSGLGLDVVYRIVQNHHGEITVESRPGETRFEVRLPFERAQATQPALDAAPSPKI